MLAGKLFFLHRAGSFVVVGHLRSPGDGREPLVPLRRPEPQGLGLGPVAARVGGGRGIAAIAAAMVRAGRSTLKGRNGNKRCVQRVRESMLQERAGGEVVRLIL